MRDKWRDDWGKFRNHCVRDETLKRKLKLKVLDHVADLLREREVPNADRAPVLLMKQSSFTRRLQDRWFKLAIVKACFQKVSLGPRVRKRFVKWAPKLLSSTGWFTEEIIDGLLRRKIADWDSYLLRQGWDDNYLSQLPGLVENVRQHADLSQLIHVLRHKLPGQKGHVGPETVKQARRMLNDALNDVYQGFLRNAMWQSPLVILDEAHHLKNPKTRISSIFGDRQETEDCLGFLDDTFDRMLFLTATPFQLGHHELIEVLKRFQSIKWEDGQSHSGQKIRYKEQLAKLEYALDESQAFARRLDNLWGTLRPIEMEQDLDACNIPLPVGAEQLAEEWWRLALSGMLASEKAKGIADLVSEVRIRNTKAQELLHPWVIRHSKPRFFEDEPSSPTVVRLARRKFYVGAAIDPLRQHLLETSQPVPHHNGLAVTGEQSLPFLLAIRAQAELARLPGRVRTYFAEGLASSYEAFHHTVVERELALDEDHETATVEDIDELTQREQMRIENWYVERIKQFVPGRNAGVLQASEHPKIAATVARTIDLWSAGEKVLVFVFYRQTASALQRHISIALEQKLLDIARLRIGQPSLRNNDVQNLLARVSQRLTDPKSSLYRTAYNWLNDRISHAFSEVPVTAKQRRLLLAVLLRYLRSFSVAARYYPLDNPEFRDAVAFRHQVTPNAQTALLASFETRLSETGKSPARQISDFLEFMKECSRPRDAVDGQESTTEFDQYLDALNRIQVGVRRSSDPVGENYVRQGRIRLLANVRAVTGETPPKYRSVVMRAFNSPLFPEILIASQILAEGVDLQRSCRMVIHHDLCWNPSLLEQRIGRVDRLGSLSADLGRPLHIFEPYLTATADEKMYRVVKDRERWFQVVMGEKFELSEIATENRAQRVPLPQSLANALTYELSVVPQIEMP